MEIDIITFKVLKELADTAPKVTDTEWAKAAWPQASKKSNPQSRIGELRAILRLMEDDKITQEEASTIIGRRWTIDKQLSLVQGLEVLKGGVAVQTKLLEAINKEKNIQKKILLKTMYSDDETLEKIDAFWELIKPSKKTDKK